MALPDPTSLATKNSRLGGRVCCRTPELKEWLDSARAAKEAGKAIGSLQALSQAARENGYDISPSAIGIHIRGLCGATRPDSTD